MRRLKNMINRILSHFGVQLVRSGVAESLAGQDKLVESSVVINDYTYNPRARDSFPHSRIGKILDEHFAENRSEYQNIVNSFAKYRDNLLDIPLEDPGVAGAPYWYNGYIPAIGGVMIYATLASLNPRYYVECGSGNTTKFAAGAIREHSLRTKIISIDPYPRAEVDALCHKMFRVPFEDMDLSFFRTLSAEDIFLVDNSHRAFPNSDVTVFFTEVLPELPSGMLYALHDIGLPNETHVHRYYNEQYMLAAYILGGMMGDGIYFPTGYLSTQTSMLHEMEAKLGLHPDLRLHNFDGFFWMRKA